MDQDSTWRSDTPSLEVRGRNLLPCGHEVADPAQPHYCHYIGLHDILPGAGVPFHGTPDARVPLNHEEANFIVVHQICELAFQRVIAELELARDAITKDAFLAASTHERWAIAWMTTAVQATRLLFRMDKDLFMQKGVGFRERVVPASGAESSQAREIELLAGMWASSPYMTVHGRTLTFREVMDIDPGNRGRKSRWWTRDMERRASEPSVVSCFQEALARHDLRLGDLMSERYLDHPMRRIGNALWGFEKTYGKFRSTHLNLAIKFLGPNTEGTAGSDGVPYLRAIRDTAKFYPDLADIMKDRKSDGPEGGWDQ